MPWWFVAGNIVLLTCLIFLGCIIYRAFRYKYLMRKRNARTTVPPTDHS